MDLRRLSEDSLNHESSPDITREQCLDLPYENHIGAFIQGSKCQYQIASRCWEEAEDLLIFSVTCLHGKQFEVQAFRTRDLPHKLYLARKRRFRRLQRSSSIHDECEQSEMKVVICRVVGGGGIDRHRIAHEHSIKPSEHHLSAAEFPQLRPSPTEVAQEYNPAENGTTYAEALSQKKKIQSHCPPDYLSRNHKGIKQRERRRETREQRKESTSPEVSDSQDVPAHGISPAQNYQNSQLPWRPNSSPNRVLSLRLRKSLCVGHSLIG
ncbi:hypothetical protein SCAR479_08553 [Seiridium cardinale]|uniref:Uncharacterized protein n=1 Tax=Seiridium cardinale TaxID=138064 RepID=A0ABR2XLQ5_9PEZI